MLIYFWISSTIKNRLKTLTLLKGNSYKGEGGRFSKFCI